MKIAGVALLLSLAFFVANAATITFINKCSYIVWPGTRTSNGKPQLSKTGFELPTGASKSVDIPSPWVGSFWARTGCSSASGKFACATGDCTTDQVNCNGAGGIPPRTLAELVVAINGEEDAYDVSNVDGFNVPLSIAPQGRNGACNVSSCPANINLACPAELQMKSSGGKVVACKSACLAFNEDQYCCRGNFGSTCQPTRYSQFFEKQCPDAYNYPKSDDKSSTFTCRGGPNYTITFCP